MRRVAAIIFVAIILASLFKAPNAQAQNDGRLHLTTSPLPISLTTTPGNSVSTELRVKNSGTETEQLQVGLLKFGANDNSGRPRLMDPEPGDDYFNWVTFSEDKFTAEPNVWHTIKMTIDVPDSGGLGYYYAVTFTRAQDVNATEGAGLHGGTAVLVLLEVDVPWAKRKLEIVEFKANKSVYEFLPAEFTIGLKNSGNIHLKPSGSIFITRGGAEVAVLSLNEGGGNVLPDSTRNFTAKWDDGFPKYKDVEQDGVMLKNDDGSPVRQLEWDLSKIGKLRFGKYKATLLAVYDDGQRDVPVEAYLTFWVIPWRIIFFGLLFALIAGAGIWAIAKNIFGLGKKKPAKKTIKSTVKSEEPKE